MQHKPSTKISPRKVTADRLHRAAHVAKKVKAQSRGRNLPAHHRSVSVIIPVLNESARVSSVVRLALRSALVGEVIVVDDGSIDGTPELAGAAGARVVTSTLLGKGASMEDGLLAAQHDTLLYLDGDLAGLCEDVVERMTEPVLKGEVDFVKARFARRAGRVTVLTARPLLATYFPELTSFEQPLGGIIAARRELLRRLRFESDYGVDVGLLIDASAAGARLRQVDIGHLEHDSQDLNRLGEMATQVARAIIERAAVWGRRRLAQVRQARERDRIHRAHPDNRLPTSPRANACGVPRNGKSTTGWMSCCSSFPADRSRSFPKSRSICSVAFALSEPPTHRTA